MYTLLGIPLLKWIHKRSDTYSLYKMTIFKLFMVGIGYSTYQGESIHITLGITKLELFTSFTIKNRWFR